LWVAASVVAPVLEVAGQPGFLGASLVVAVVGVLDAAQALPQFAALALAGRLGAVALVWNLGQDLNRLAAGRTAASGRHGDAESALGAGSLGLNMS